MKKEILIEKMQLQHIAQVLEIEQDCFSEPWTYNGFYNEIYNGQSYFVVATVGNDVAGYAGMYCVFGDCFVTNIAVKKNYRRAGVGKSLLQSLFSYAENQKANFISLEVRASNDAAKALYKKFGFKEVGTRKNFYTKPIEDAIIMNLYL